VTLLVFDAVNLWVSKNNFEDSGFRKSRTWTSPANFFAIPLIFSYRITGFFLRLSSTAVIPWTALSSAEGSQAFGVELYRCWDGDGTWFRENRQGRIGQ
jgi:hypothetical protein